MSDSAQPVILHIEDNPSNRKVVQHIVRTTDYRLIEATDGEQGVEMALAEAPDVILMDVQLPLMSGYDVARTLKADPRSREIPIVAVTSYALSGDDSRALEAGCEEYLAKPFRPRQLLECLAKYLSRSD